MKMNRFAVIVTVLIGSALFAYASDYSLFLDNGYQALFYHSVMLEESYPALNPIAIAMEEFKKAVQEGLQADEARLMIGLLYEYLNRPGSALGYYLDFAKNQPQEVWINPLIGDLYLQLGRTDDALYYFERAIANGEETFAQAHWGVGRIAWEQGDYRRAQEAFELALADAPDYLDARLALGKTLYHLQDYAEAIAVLETALLQSSGFAPIYYYLGLSYEAAGQLEQAEHAFSRYEELTVM